MASLIEPLVGQKSYLLVSPQQFEICAWQADGLPKYDIAWVKQQHPRRMCLFWGHHQSQAGIVDKSSLSQWYPSSFVYRGEQYCCAEQFMMACKAELFGDLDIKERLLLSKEPKLIKALGRQVSNFDQELWDKFKHSIVLMGNWCKFSQNPDLADFLLSTHNRLLVEASPVDKIWGIGLAADHEDATNINKWRGLNLLGFALMEVRDELKRVRESS